MIPFLLLATLLVAGALLLVLPPLFGRGHRGGGEGVVDQATTALAVLREQLADLDGERAAGRLDEEEHARRRDELERRALDEGLGSRATEEPARVMDRAKGWALGVLVVLPAAAVAFYLILGAPEGLDPAKVAGEAQSEFSAEQINQMVLTLAARMENEPDNLEGWAMLARSYSMLGRAQEAESAYRHLAEKMPDSAQAYADWADALGSANGQTLIGAAEPPIARALELDPRNVKALALAGSLAFEKADYAAAARHWEAILVQVPPEEQAFANSIRASIAEARKKGGMQPLAEAAVPRPATMAAPGVRSLTLAGEISLAPALAAQAKPDDVVFVFVRPADGGPPLAAQRYSVAQLPLRVDFSGSTPMTPGASVPERVTLGARVSKSGNPMAASGDLEGLSPPVAPGEKGLVVAIDRVHP